MKAHEKLKEGVAQMKSAFLGHGPHRVIDGMAIGMISKRHMIVLGPPGEAKTMITRGFAKLAFNNSFFTVQTNPTTSPDEVFGPIDGHAYIEKGVYQRIIERKAWSAKCWLLDEGFKCNDAVLHALLKNLEERKADNGRDEMDIPLELCVLASNEYPRGGTDGDHAAFWDRCPMRFWLDRLSEDDVDRLLMMDEDPLAAITVELTDDDIEELRAAAEAVCWGEAEVKTFRAIRDALGEEGFSFSTRTKKTARRIVKAKAAYEGRDHIVASDWRVLADVLWSDHKDRERIFGVIGNASDPYGARADAITDALRIAMGEVPAIDLLKNGTFNKAEFLAKIGKVQTQVAGLLDKVGEALDEAKQNVALEEAMNTVTDALESIREQTYQASCFRKAR